MIILDHIEALVYLCKTSRKWGMYAGFGGNDGLSSEEIGMAAPWINAEDHGQLLADGSGYVLCDSEEELSSVYLRTIGDDGPTAENPYDGPARVHAVTCSPYGELVNENT